MWRRGEVLVVVLSLLGGIPNMGHRDDLTPQLYPNKSLTTTSSSSKSDASEIATRDGRSADGAASNTSVAPSCRQGWMNNEGKKYNN